MKKVNILDFSCVKDFELNPSAKAKLKKFYCGFRDIYCLITQSEMKLETTGMRE